MKMNKELNKELLKYLEDNIIPKYTEFDSAHNISHVKSVIKYSLLLGKKLDLDLNICLTIAAYHDIGLYKNREEHHTYSKKYVLQDKNLSKWFSDREIRLIANSCKEHRASGNKIYSSTYSKVVSDADKLGSLDINSMISRSIKYTLSKYNNSISKDKLYNNVHSHLISKYGKGGYAKLNLSISKDLVKDTLINTKTALENEPLFKKYFNEIYNKEVNKL